MEEPTEEDCCHSDCVNCVLDIYQRQKSPKGLSILKPANHTNSLMSQTRYRPFRLVKIDSDAPNVFIYSFALDDSVEDETRLYFTPGEHVVLRNEPSMNSEHLSRPYTLIPWGESATFSVMIKLYAAGKMSQYINQWRVGQKCHWRGPYGDFSYEPNTYKNVYMICMGTGIAPMYAISKQIIENEEDETVIHLLYGSKTPEDIIFRKDINELSNYWNFSCTHFISNDYHESQKKFNETFVNERLTAESISKTIKYSKNTLVLICGSEEFNSNFCDMFNGVPEIKVHVFS
uniref:NADH-cytochrome b5 reductase n=1 Tax=Lygus hesperus TaxID=30085 RepID=A0A0A9YDL2_LYGHE